MDDIDKIFDDACDPVIIQSEKINHFLYADDLVILLQSKDGLHKSIDKAFEFSESKHLTISCHRPKVENKVKCPTHKQAIYKQYINLEISLQILLNIYLKLIFGIF